MKRRRLRRLAREAALQALYAIELGQSTTSTAIEEAMRALEDEEFGEGEVGDVDEFTDEGRDLVRRYAHELADGAWRARGDLDVRLQELIPKYDLQRLAAVDRNILRLIAWELDNVLFVPPAVSLNEAVELAKRYSTTESGRFVNGVLGSWVKSSPKARWNPTTAPKDPDLTEIERVERTPEPEVLVETVEAESEEAKLGQKFGKWTLRPDADPDSAA